eukprot:SAG25_NODE_2976_length_1285_cov_1.468803_2_plen_55_part_01
MPLLLVMLLSAISFFGVSIMLSIVREFDAVVANLAATARACDGYTPPPPPPPPPP